MFITAEQLWTFGMWLWTKAVVWAYSVGMTLSSFVCSSVLFLLSQYLCYAKCKICKTDLNTAVAEYSTVSKILLNQEHSYLEQIHFSEIKAHCSLKNKACPQFDYSHFKSTDNGNCRLFWAFWKCHTSKPSTPKSGRFSQEERK